MTIEEAIEELSGMYLVATECSSEDYAKNKNKAIDMAISALKNQAISDKTSDKYRWHDLRQNQEDLPEELAEVNITWVNNNPVPYYEHIKGIPFSEAMGIYCGGKWWWSATCKDELEEYGYCDIDAMAEEIEVIAWREIEPFDEDINVTSKEDDDEH